MSDVLVLCYHAVSEQLAVRARGEPRPARRADHGAGATWLSRHHLHPGGHRPAVAAHAGDHVRRRVSLDARPGRARARPPRGARHGVRADRLGRARRADVLARDRGVGRTGRTATSSCASPGTAWGSWPSRDGRWARTRARIRACRRSWTTPALERELAGSRELLLERLGRCDSIAYPYGDYDDRVVRGAGAAGYRAACTLTGMPHAATRAELAARGCLPRQPPAVPEAEDLAGAALAGGGRRAAARHLIALTPARRESVRTSQQLRSLTHGSTTRRRLLQSIPSSRSKWYLPSASRGMPIRLAYLRIRSG